MPVGAGTPRYENWVHWLMEGSGVVCAAHPAPSWGQAPALHFSLATLDCPGLGGWFAGRRRSRIGVRDMLSYQSPMPAAAGTPRYEKPELCLGTTNWHAGFCDAPPRPQRGTCPRATFAHSARPLDNSARFAGGKPASRLIGGHIPDRSPGHAFIAIAHAGHRRHTKV